MENSVELTDKDIEEITKLTNKRIHKNFPMLEHPIKDFMTREILETLKEGKWKS